jgi:hypothetical protein
MSERKIRIPLALIEKIIQHILKKKKGVVNDFWVSKMDRKDYVVYKINMELNEDLCFDKHDDNVKIISIYLEIHYLLKIITSLNRNQIRIIYKHSYFKVTPLNHSIIYRTPILI